MSDITVQLIPDHEPLPINDDPLKDYGELNYIFYPGISKCQLIRLTNNTGADITPNIYFDADDTDDIYWKTMRIYPTCSGVLPSGVSDVSWSGTITASGTQDLYVRSICTKEGFSWKYKGAYWTNSGFNVIDDEYINDAEEQGPAVDCDSANAGSTLVLDTLTTLPVGTRIDEEFCRVKFSVDAHVHLTCNIQYSDNGSVWTTVYTGADLSITDHRYQVTFWWPRAGAHRYWRIYKTNAAAAGGNITDIQWLLFEAHEDAYDFGVYGDHECLMRDSTGHMDDFKWKTSIQVATDIFARQSYNMPIGKIGKRSKIMAKNFEREGKTVQLYYIPTATFSYSLNTKSDFQLEKRVWNVKAIITPQKRNMTYTAATDGLAPSLYRYDQRSIIFEPFGPDKVGWYMTNYDFFHAYGHSYYILWDSRCYKVDDPQPVYIDDELVAFSARIFIQGDMTNLTTDPRNYVLTNRDGLFLQFPNGGYNLPSPTDLLDLTTPEQRPTRWAGAYITWTYTRPLNYSNAPTPYSLTGTNSPSDGYPTGEMYITQEWNNPQSSTFQTAEAVAFGVKVDATAGLVYYQMPRYYNWLGFADTASSIDVVYHLVQVYLDEDCTIPVTINCTPSQTFAKIENVFDEAYVTAAGLVTLTALGGTIYTDGHLTRTPSKLYVRYIPEDSQGAYYYP